MLVNSSAKLKDFLIPHVGNNYKPHALHPKRLFFHAAGAVLIKALVIVVALSLPMEAWLTPNIEAEQGQKIIALTNDIRRHLSLNSLTEDSQLMQAAYYKVEDMLTQQYFAHVGPDNKSLRDWLRLANYNFSVAGENLAMGFSRPEDVVNAWIKSPTHYANIIDPDFQEIGVGVDSGLYNGHSTTFIAQYFGTKKTTNATLASSAGVSGINQIAQTDSLQNSAAATEINGQTTSKNNQLIVMDSPFRNESTVRIEAFLQNDTKQAIVNINGFTITLNQDIENPSRWTGRAVITEEEKNKIFSPVVLPTVNITNASGQNSSQDLNISGVQPVEPSILSQYFFIRSNLSEYLSPLFNLSSIYFKFLAIFLFIALLLNIFVEIRKQHPHIIASSLGLLGILLLLIAL